ncbi:hypothetical protein CAPTEDRAFT_227143 [Capitella teleta]|uniref:SUEL-type lectin domain-containing protein n=1 Tax=Capitella teleta TaxID=283909 RepID=R7TAD9_CAPTE|nr:hypothetical protein CAPTEDRAFT_227143 [Capitella teleta]|eukprot:ELT90698.1 hypothetical protein CAPTEDRAFT_227143 [Capitella teleta]
MHGIIKITILNIFFLSIFSLIDVVRTLEIKEGSTVESCVFEDFTARCAYDETIVITNAKFGHIKLSRCIDKDLGFFGCFADVSTLIGDKCTSKRSCTIPVSEIASQMSLECARGLQVFLETSYACIRGVLSTGICDSLEAAPTEKYFLTSKDFSKSCATSGYLTIRAQEGQHVETSLIDISMNMSSLAEGIKIIDEGIEHLYERQRGVLKRHQWGYVSRSSQITLVLISATPVMIITYKAVGCLDITIPRDAYAEKHGQDLIVKCHKTEQSWNLRCIGTRWLGSIGTCYIPTQNPPPIIAPENTNNGNLGSDDVQQYNPLRKEVIIGIITVATLILCCFVFGVGYACSRRLKIKYLPNKDYEKCEMVAVDGTISRMLKTDNVNTWQNTMNPTMSRNDHAPVVAMERDFITVNTNNF